MIGKVISHYSVTGKLGAGGMGEVYRARDNKLGRDVALKVLPESLAADSARIARFQREAQLLASLNHPNIGSIYGLEEAEGVRCLVLELVEGPTLADRITGGPIPLQESLTIARQIAEALEAAHEKGIIHRDLKPANVKVTPDGAVKVLDFGLAKAFEGEGGGEDVSNSPTLTVAATQAGVILGTAAYMSPEQARAKAADRRADIWAFGAVLYEMLTGKQAFGGETVSDTLAAVLRAEPDWEALPAETPATIRKLLRRCIQKDRKQRLQAIGEARIAIDEYLADPTGASGLMSAAATAPQPLWRRTLPWAIAGVVAIIAALALWAPWRARQEGSQPPIRLSVTLPPTEPLGSSELGGPAVALSPDASRLVYVARDGESTRLYLRTMEKFEAEPITGTGRVSAPFFSPDGRWVGFFDGNEGKLKKVAVTGGTAVAICDAPGGVSGATWSPDDTVFFAPLSLKGLWRVSASGGKPEQVTAPDAKQDERNHGFPEFLPGGRSILFTIQTSSNFDEARVAVLSLKTGQWRTLLEGGSNPRYVHSGHIVFARAGSLLAVPFDLGRLAVTGPPVPILEGVDYSSIDGYAQYSLSANGSLVYAPGGSSQSERTLVWVNRRGAAHPLTEIRRAYEDLTLSPDGRRVALTIEGPLWNIWVFDQVRGTLSRVTFEGDNRDPLWSADGKRIVYSSFRERRYGLFWKLADGSGPEQYLTSGEYQLWVNSWSHDGRLLAFTETNPVTGADVWVLSLEGDRKPQPFLRTPFNEGPAMFSPDGRWLAYESDESGRSEVYVQAFPGPGGKWQISGGGGQRPVWARDGRELYYRNGDKLMAVEVTTQPTFSAGKPRVLFEGRYLATGLTYAVTPDGQRFIMIKEGEDLAGPTQINVVLNWFSELRRRVVSSGPN